jgi:hypothetical protein
LNTIVKLHHIIDKRGFKFESWLLLNSDDLTYYISTNGNMARTNSRLAQIIKTGLKSEFSKRTIADVVFGERSEIMVNIKHLQKQRHLHREFSQNLGKHSLK